MRPELAMTMQPEIPWNVAGIAPEARDAARTSARREGLSVGEWLTRRILRSLGESEPANEDFWAMESPVPRTTGKAPLSLRQNGEGSAWAKPGESDTKDLQAQNERELSRIAARLNQRQNARGRDKPAQSEAVVPIDIAVRERAATHAVEQLTARIAQLDARLAQIERTITKSDSSHGQSVKALQEKVATLAGEVEKTASHASAQTAQLAAAMEAVANKFIQARGEASDQQQVLEEKIAALVESVGSVSDKLLEQREETDRNLRGVQDRLATMEVTVGEFVAETAVTSRLSESFDQLSRRFEEAGAEHARDVARVEQRVNRIETDGAEAIIDMRLRGIERALADMSEGMEKGARERMNASDAVHAELRNLASRIDSAEQRHAAALAEKPPVQSPDATRDIPVFEPVPILDLPPFPERPQDDLTAPPPPVEPAVSPLNDLRGSPPGEHSDVAQALQTAGVDSFLAEARRNARLASPTPEPRSGAFSWLDPAADPQANENSNMRLVLLGTIGLLVLTAVGAGLYFSTMFVEPGTAPHASMVATRLAPHMSPPVQQTVSSAATTAAPVLAQKGKSDAIAVAALAPAAVTTRAKPVTRQTRLATLAGAGNAKAQEVLGLEYLDGDGVPVNEAQGAKWLARAAAQGEAVAAYRLGTLYERGRGVAPDQKIAVQWYAAAAKAGNRKAMHNLAVSYAQGTGVPKDVSVAARWFVRAANLGLADSQFNLAVLYERGLGVPQSLAEAYKWYAIAAAQGDAESKARMEAIASQMSARDKAVAEKAVVAFRPSPFERTANAPPIAASLLGS